MTTLLQKEQRHAQVKTELAALVDKIKAETDEAALTLLNESLVAKMAELEEAKADVEAAKANAETLAKASALLGEKPAKGPFAQVDDKKGGFDSVADFARAVYGACLSPSQSDPRLHAAGQVYGAVPGSPVTTYSPEGYALPAAFAGAVFANIYSGGSNLLNLFKFQPTASRAIPYYSTEESAYGTVGVQTYWTSEGSAITASRPAGQIGLIQTHPIAALVQVTEELMEDAPRLNETLAATVPLKMYTAISDTILNGNGQTRPKGFMAAAGGSRKYRVTVAKESGQAPASINAVNIAKMLSSAILNDGPMAGGDVFWLAHQSVLSQLATLTIGNMPVFMPDVTGATAGTLMGYKVHYSQLCQPLGAEGDLILCNAVGYAGFVRKTATFAESVHLYFDANARALRWTMNVGGQPMLSDAIADKNGSGKKSYFVTLAERA